MMLMAVFVGVLVRVFVGMFADNCGVMRVPVLTLMGVRMAVRMRVIMHMPGIVSMSVHLVRVGMICVTRMCVVRGNVFAGHHIHLGSGKAAAAHLAHLQARAHIQRSRGLCEHGQKERPHPPARPAACRR